MECEIHATAETCVLHSDCVIIRTWLGAQPGARCFENLRSCISRFHFNPKCKPIALDPDTEALMLANDSFSFLVAFMSLGQDFTYFQGPKPSATLKTLLLLEDSALQPVSTRPHTPTSQTPVRGFKQQIPSRIQCEATGSTS